MNRRLTVRSTLASLSALLLASPAFAQTPAAGDQPTPPTTQTPASPAEPAAPVPATPPATMVQPAPAMTEPMKPDAPPAEAAPATPAKPAVLAKWDSQLYGFVEADTIFDSTQGFNESAGNGAIARPNTYTGDHPQLTDGARNSRIGYRLAAPEYNGIKASAQLEMDFLGNQPATTEAATFQNGTFRFRHMNLKMETDYVDVLIGQYWELFGWQSYFHPNTVEIQGVVGQIYSRTPQIRLSKTIKTENVNVDIAVAALRSPQRDSAIPDGQAGIKLSFPKWKGWHTAGATGSAYDAAAIGVSVLGRRFDVNEFAAKSESEKQVNGYGYALDALLPLYGGMSKENHANAVALTGEFANGAGDADLYTGLNGNVSEPSLAKPPGATTAPTYTPNIDNGLAMFTTEGVLHPVHWQSYIVGLQYYLPPSGKVWLSLDYSHIQSDNDSNFSTNSKAWDKEYWGSANLFWEVVPAVRLGLEGAYYNQHYVDDVTAKDYRVQFSGFFIF